MDKICAVYSFRHIPTGRRYIGSSRDVHSRRREHLKRARLGGLSCFHRALREFGKDSFEFEVLRVCKDGDERFNAEKHFITFYNSASTNGFNTRSDPTKTYDHRHSEITKLRISMANKGNKPSKRCIEASVRRHKGRRLTDEHKKKIGDAVRGQSHPGWHFTLAQRRRMSLKRRGAMNSFFGRRHTAETKRKLAEMNTGKKLSPETRTKLSEALRRRWRKFKSSGQKGFLR